MEEQDWADLFLYFRIPLAAGLSVNLCKGGFPPFPAALQKVLIFSIVAIIPSCEIRK
jgi:hypothetical protein